jgi:DNA-binding response OmpR family regulator
MAKILVIDDSVSILEQLKQTLSEEGYEVFTANCGEAGLKMLQTEAVDLVLTDIYMPGLNGMEVMQLARQLHPAVRLVAMSSGADSNLMRLTAKTVGAYITLKKPFNLADLHWTVEAALDLECSPPCGRELGQSA